MAKPKNTKKHDAKPEKVRVSHTIDASLYRRFRIAAAELDITESDLFELLVTDRLSAVHSRGVPENLKNGTSDLGQGIGAPGEPPVPTVRIPNVQNRLNDIARRAHGPVDDALDGLVNESA